MKQIILNLLLLLFPVGMAYGQIPEIPKSVLSPTAASLGLYGEVPVSHFTGTPSIQIPLYEIRVDNHVFPLSLSYHASGVHPDQHGSWTGLGWNLNAGGVISRIVKDMPDDYNNPKLLYGEKSGYYFTHSVLDTNNWNQRNYLREVAQNSEKCLKDTEPDIFSFNFLNYSGKFMLTHKGEWKVQCDKPVKVELHDPFLEIPFPPLSTAAQQFGNFPSFGGFTLTAEDGTQYVFGGTNKAIEYSTDFFGQNNDSWTATSWYLTEIIYTNGKKITLSYSRYDYICQMYISVNLCQYTYIETSGGFLDKADCDELFSFSRNIDDHYAGKLISPVYLERIDAPDFSVAFESYISDGLRYDERIFRKKMEKGTLLPYLYPATGGDYLTESLKNLQWQKLTGIWITDREGAGIRWFRLKYNDSSSERLMLESVMEYGADQETGGRIYKFEYETPEKLPPYLSNKVDHWGFYNNKEAVLTDFEAYYGLRNPNPAALQYGILKRITYPTGGYTRLVFEPHDYRKQLKPARWESCEELTENKTAGGLRIKRIIDSDTGAEADEKVSKEYLYVTDYVQNKEAATISSGVLGGVAQYEFKEYVVQDVNGEHQKHHKYFFSSQSVLPGSENSMGSHIGYTEVIEKRTDGSFTRYRFTNLDNGHLDEPADAIIQQTRTPYEPYASTSVERGQIILQEDYTADGTIKRKKETTYEKSSDTSEDFVRSMKAASYYLCGSAGLFCDEGASYRTYMYSYRKVDEQETLYDNAASPLVTSIGYEYNAQGLLRKKSQSVNAGVKHLLYQYPADVQTDVCRSMASKHVLSPVIEEKTELANGGVTYPLLCHRYTYTPLQGGTDRFFGLKKVEQSVGSSPFREKLSCYRYDAKGNMVHVKENETDVVYLWGYNYRYIVAELRNTTVEEVEKYIGSIEKFSAAEAPDLQQLALLRKHLADALITTYTYAPTGLTSVTDPQGKTTYYQYDPLGRLSFEKDYLGRVRCAYDYQYSIK